MASYLRTLESRSTQSTNLGCGFGTHSDCSTGRKGNPRRRCVGNMLDEPAQAKLARGRGERGLFVGQAGVNQDPLAGRSWAGKVALAINGSAFIVTADVDRNWDPIQ